MGGLINIFHPSNYDKMKREREREMNLNEQFAKQTNKQT